ncbi:MAG: flagellar motor switch phosphatase FliY [Lachnospiraceae bacterium]|nr:flagellar motor switch phosphatase FliY [Candidatus Colinaster scatohippi]
MDGGILSQDEINALLNGMANGEMPPEPEPVSEPEPEPAPAFEPSPAVVVDDDFELNDIERDAIGEVANISMGTSATTLFSLVNKKVNITTPVVTLSNWPELQEQNKERPCVFIQIKYTSGLDGSNILILTEHDVKVITDLMMGGDGTNTDGELGELHLSAISEAMNQMMGSSATSLSQMLGKMIDISPPVAQLIDMQDNEIKGSSVADFLNGTFVKIAFRMQIDELVDSQILQLYPIDFAKEIVQTFMGGDLFGTEEPEPEPEAPKVEAYTPPVVDTPPTPTPAPAMAPAAAPMPDMAAQPMMGMPAMDPNMAMQGMPMMPGYGMPMMGMPMMGMPNQGMNYQPAQFESFQGNLGALASNENIDLILDVPLEVTVELGRTRKSIAEILDFSPGTIIELDKIAGEPIDVLVNGKFVAKGEVVVIEESFGIRVTEITK